MTIISHRLQDILAAIAAAKLTGNASQNVQLLAVSKAQTADAMRALADAGQKAFGENYVQEALNKQTVLNTLGYAQALTWHFIGPIQSNKTALIATHFDWVHGVDRLKIAQRLNDARGNAAGKLQVCIQLNVSNEDSKSGVTLDNAIPFAHAMAKMPNLQLRGVMAIPAPTDDITLQRAQFKAVRECYEALNAHGFALDTLSMGMSGDFASAIAEGATIIRLGTALFGARQRVAEQPSQAEL